jgi:dolichol kinase
MLILFGSNINIACASIIILALGDSFSTLAGKRYGRHKIFYNPEKSFEGSIGGFVPAFIGAMVFVPPEVALFGAFMGMNVESLSLRIDDNISIPLISGFFMTLL